MKIRTDFVTNSSSSSFVIAYREMPKIDDDTLRKYPSLRFFPKLIDSIMDEDSGCDTDKAVILKTKDEFDKYFIERYGWRDNHNIQSIIKDDNYLKERYHNAIDYLRKGYYIAEKDIGYGDDSLLNIVEVLGKDNDDFIILESE